MTIDLFIESIKNPALRQEVKKLEISQDDLAKLRVEVSDLYDENQELKAQMNKPLAKPGKA